MVTTTHSDEVRQVHERVLASASVRSRFVDVGTGERVHILEIGDGPPLVLIHGTTSPGLFFLPLLEHLNGVRALAADRPGRGLSDPTDLPRDRFREAAVGWVDRLLDALRLDRAAMLGHSMGGLWALWYALAHPDRVDRLVLLGTPALPRTRCPLPFRVIATPGEDALRRVQIRPGVRFLDVACGSGALAIPAARRGAEVTAVDLAPTMIERLIARASAEGLSGITGRVMNGEALEAEFLGFLLAALHAAVPGFTPPSMDPPPPPMQLADPATLRSVLADAGLTDVRVDTVTWEMPFQSASDFWDVATSGNPITVQLTGDLTAEQVAQARRVSDGMLNERSGGEPGAVLHAEMNIGTGRKP